MVFFIFFKILSFDYFFLQFTDCRLRGGIYSFDLHPARPFCRTDHAIGQGSGTISNDARVVAQQFIDSGQVFEYEAHIAVFLVIRPMDLDMRDDAGDGRFDVVLHHTGSESGHEEVGPNPECDGKDDHEAAHRVAPDIAPGEKRYHIIRAWLLPV